MDNNQLDKLFREKLSSHTSPVERSDEMWDQIASSLDKGAVQKRVRWRKKLLYAFSSAAAALVVVWSLFTPHSTQSPELAAETLKSEDFLQSEGSKTEKINPSFLKATPTNLLIEASDSLVIGTPASPPASITAVKDEEPSLKKASTVSGESQIVDDFYELFNEPSDLPKPKRKTKYLLALASNVATGSNSNTVNNISQRVLMASGQNDWSNGVPNIEQVSETKYALPLNLGVQIQIRVNSLLAVGAGVNYSMLRSKYDGLVDKKMHSVQQTLHYIGVPINLYATILQKNGFFVYANIGGAIEKGVRASYALKSYDETTRYQTAIDGVQFSANLGLGAEFRFIKQLGIYLEPNAVYFFNSKVTNSIRTDQPFQLKAEIGFRLHL